MGEQTSRQHRAAQKKQQSKLKSYRQIQEIYSMFDQSVSVVKSSIIMNSDYQKHHQSNAKTSRISNLESVLQQLLQSFSEKGIYSWGKQICCQFKKHFAGCFQQIWPLNKEEFYLILLKNCHFDTTDYQEEIQKMVQGLNLQEDQQTKPNRQSYQRLFYDVGAVTLQQKLPQSFIGEQVGWQSFKEENEDQKRQFNLNAINATIINNQYITQNLSSKKREQDADTDFLPLFIGAPGSATKNESKIAEQIIEMKRNARIQNCSLIMPETVFIDRMSQDSKAQISDLVKFYREFANALQQLFFSVSLISSPLKHFLITLKEKMKRKNINGREGRKQKQGVSRLLLSETDEGKQARLRRQINNNILLQQISDFTWAYTEFVWKYLQLYEISQSKLGKLINTDTLYGIVLKAVWKYVQWISQRGSQYEQKKLEQIYQDIAVPNRTSIPFDRKDYLMKILGSLKIQRNPQKYLKKIVIFYRETSKSCSCADDLLNIYEELIIRLIKDGYSRQLGIFRMKNVIQKLLRIDESLHTGGEISYSWTTWCILVEMLKQKIMNQKYGSLLNLPKQSRMQTEPDYETVNVDQQAQIAK